MLKLILYLSTISISHTHNCCGFLSCVYPLCTGGLACRGQKCIPREKCLSRKCYRTGRERLQPRFFGLKARHFRSRIIQQEIHVLAAFLCLCSIHTAIFLSQVNNLHCLKSRLIGERIKEKNQCKHKLNRLKHFCQMQ